MFNGKKTVDSVIKTFNKAITDLDSIMRACEDEHTTQEIKCIEAEQAMKAALEEGTRAERVQDKLKALVE